LLNSQRKVLSFIAYNTMLKIDYSWKDTASSDQPRLATHPAAPQKLLTVMLLEAASARSEHGTRKVFDCWDIRMANLYRKIINSGHFHENTLFGRILRWNMFNNVLELRLVTLYLWSCQCY
jgi:hypothetical protein